MPTIRVTDEDRDEINRLCSLHGMSQEVIIGRLVGENKKYNLFENGWKRKLAESEFEKLLEDTDLEFRKKLELDKHRAILKAKMMVFQEYIKTLPASEKKQFLENVLGDVNSGNFLENLSSYQMFFIDGEKKLFMPDSEGYPVIPGIKRDRLIQCERGFHIENSRCTCSLWRECPHGSTKYEDWLGKYGTQAQQDSYLRETTGHRAFLTRRDYR